MLSISIIVSAAIGTVIGLFAYYKIRDWKIRKNCTFDYYRGVWVPNNTR